MNHDFNKTMFVYNLSEVNQLIDYVRHHAVDSEQTPICSDEISIVTNRLIQQLIWNYPYLDQVLQEVLDDLRFRV